MNPVVSERLGEEMNSWAVHMRAIVTAWQQVGSQARGALALDSPFSRDRLDFRASHPDAPQNIEAASLYTGEYVSAIGQYVLAIAALFETNQAVLSVWPLIRAELEIAGRIAWLLAPGSSESVVSSTLRIARFQMEFLATLCRERFTASQMKNRGRERESKTIRDRLRADLMQVFPDAQTDWSEPGDERSWDVGGVKYVGLGHATKLFAESCMGDDRGLYDVLSDYSHPSLFRLRAQSSMVDTGQGFQALMYEVPPGMLEWQARIACTIFYKSAHLVAGYFGLDDRPLELWAASVPSEWFVAEGK
ncbi:hypothetical protein ACJEIK_18265 [Mycobacterium sp. SMC-16]|uniref:hypothetical protein n=1 Tax=Mycobacterium sp. SMC-16 TaxID=3385967 RepID=UPI00390CA95D